MYILSNCYNTGMAKNKAFFDALYRLYNRKNLISPDPLEFLSRWPSVPEREAGALLAACFAYGNVKAILKNLHFLFGIMPQPRTYILAATPARLKKDFKHFKYRFTTGAELSRFILNIQQVLLRYGTLEACFASALAKQDATAENALKHFARCLRSGGAVNTLVPDPDKKSALKRLNLFLRWMVRRDEVDPGGWHIPARLLIVPLDVHMHRCARALGLTRRRSADMKTALDITHALAAYCPQDPVKYDFCITRFGIRPDMDEQTLAPRQKAAQKAGPKARPAKKHAATRKRGKKEMIRTYGQKPFHLVFLHGGPGAAGSVAGPCRVLGEQAGVLEPWQSKYTVFELVEELDRQIQAFAQKPVTLIGHSWGAWLSLLYAAANPQQVAALVWIGCPPLEESYAAQIAQRRLANLSAEQAKALQEAQAALEHGPESARARALPIFQTLCQKADFVCPFHEPEEEVPPPDEKAFARVWPQAAALRAQGTLLKAAQMLACPLTLIHGEQDPHPLQGVSAPLTRLGVPFQAFALPRCGHTPWAEKYARKAFFRVLFSLLPQQAR